MTMLAAAAWTGVAITAYSAYNSDQNAKKMLAASDPFGSQRGYYSDKLRTLMNNPAGALRDPGFQASMMQGEQAVNRGMAASGFVGSGNQATALMDYAYGKSNDYLLQQEQFLANLAGAGISPNSANAAASMFDLSAKQSNSAMQQLGAILQMSKTSGGGINAGTMADNVAAPSLYGSSVGFA
jgi:hypothetical protein